MAKSKKDNIDSFGGIFNTPEPQIEGQTSSEKDFSQHNTTPASEDKPKRAGRPKVNRETKKRISFTILPSLYEKASVKASNEGKSVSELISEFLTEYVNR